MYKKYQYLAWHHANTQRYYYYLLQSLSQMAEPPWNLLQMYVTDIKKQHINTDVYH